MRSLKVRCESWGFARPFAISRGSRTAVQVVVVEITEGEFTGCGECVPYPHYGESVDGVMAAIGDCEELISTQISLHDLRQRLRDRISAGAVRNALDCALWDLEAKQTGQRAWGLAGIAEPAPVITAETIGIGTVEEMAASAQRLKDSPLIKVKLDAHSVIARIRAIHERAPKARLIIDPNEAWTVEQLTEYAPILATLGVEMIEQPVPAGQDEGLAKITLPVTICADEACHTVNDLVNLVGKYQMINIKLDKSGGLTEALRLAQAAKENDFSIMIGCMVGTSLAMAPAMLLSQYATYVDLDGPLLLRKDRVPGLKFKGGMIYPPIPEVWG